MRFVGILVATACAVALASGEASMSAPEQPRATAYRILVTNESLLNFYVAFACAPCAAAYFIDEGEESLGGVIGIRPTENWSLTVITPPASIDIPIYEAGNGAGPMTVGTLDNDFSGVAGEREFVIVIMTSFPAEPTFSLQNGSVLGHATSSDVSWLTAAQLSMATVRAGVV